MSAFPFRKVAAVAGVPFMLETEIVPDCDSPDVCLCVDKCNHIVGYSESYRCLVYVTDILSGVIKNFDERFVFCPICGIRLSDMK